MKEVAWAVSKPGQAKLVLIAPNIQIPCPDSILLTQVRGLVAKCRDVGVPVLMGPSRKQLGMAFRTSGVTQQAGALTGSRFLYCCYEKIAKSRSRHSDMILNRIGWLLVAELRASRTRVHP